MAEGRRISFHFHPREEGGTLWAVEKEENGVKRRYLEGVSSGLQVDGAGERMTEKAIEGFHNQAQSGDVLLYSGKHGVDFTDDVGKLVYSEIQPNGDWMTRYRLYDNGDGLGPATLEKCDKIWRQLNGLPPYRNARKKGFSVEGSIPEGGLLDVDGSGKRVMNNVELDGVLLVSKPAYTESVARAVYKALGLVMPGDMRRSLRAGLEREIVTKAVQDDYFSRCYAIQSALDEKVHVIMNMDSPEKADMLRTLFAEYSDLMVELILRSEPVFQHETPAGGDLPVRRSVEPRDVMMQRLTASMSLLQKSLAQRGLVESADR